MDYSEEELDDIWEQTQYYHKEDFAWVQSKNSVAHLLDPDGSPYCGIARKLTAFSIIVPYDKNICRSCLSLRDYFSEMTLGQSKKRWHRKWEHWNYAGHKGQKFWEDFVGGHDSERMNWESYFAPHLIPRSEYHIYF